ncbi:MAG: diphosphomevalonate decarboxylase [Spirochaetia bacterium]|nr:diphosphomevalonate decarboxylase [Spirochaetia bacterium]
MVTKQEFVQNIIGHRKAEIRNHASEFAPANIALCKYWGKRDRELNLPVTDSLSISMGHLGTRTEVRISPTGKDTVIFNGKVLSSDAEAAAKILDFAGLMKPADSPPLEISTVNNIPTGAGVASSASGFAALTQALNSFFGYALTGTELSLLAGLGSGSASRSVFTGFVHRHRGQRADGMDSFSEPIPYRWPELRIGLLTVSGKQKKVGSGAGMNRTAETSVLFRSWSQQVQQDMELLMQALEQKDFPLLGATAENNALAMHACMLSAKPPLIYWMPETLAVIQKVQELRHDGLQLYLTIDAGPNVKLLYEAQDEETVLEAFPDAETVRPFTALI